MPEVQSLQSDEIDLFELFDNLWKQKVLVGVTTIVVSLFGISYAFYSQEIYKAEAKIVKPTKGEIARFNNMTSFEVNADSVFITYLKKLESTELKKEFLTQNKESLSDFVGDDEVAKALFTLNALIAINYHSLKDEAVIQEDILTPSISLKAKSASQATDLLNEFLALAAEQVVLDFRQEFDERKAAKLSRLSLKKEQLISSLKIQRENQIIRLEEKSELAKKKLEDELTARKAFLKNTRIDRIALLEEAIWTADKLGIKQPTSMDVLTKNQIEKRVEISADINHGTQGEPLYLKGTTLLQAELQALKSRPKELYLDKEIRQLEQELAIKENNRQVEILKTRKFDIAFNDELQKIQDTIDFTRTELFPENFTLSFKDGEAFTSSRPLKSKRKTILFSIILGGVLGLILALIRSEIIKRKEVIPK